jgi:hypothetical protein
MRRLIPAALVAIACLSMPFVVDGRPNRYGHSDREERHMLPSVSSAR